MQVGKSILINIQISPMKEEEIEVYGKGVKVKKFEEVFGLYELSSEEKGEYEITITSSVGTRVIKINVD